MDNLCGPFSCSERGTTALSEAPQQLTSPRSCARAASMSSARTRMVSLPARPHARPPTRLLARPTAACSPTRTHARTHQDDEPNGAARRHAVVGALDPDHDVCVAVDEGHDLLQHPQAALDAAHQPLRYRLLLLDFARLAVSILQNSPVRSRWPSMVLHLRVQM